jgi:glycosyltransferase involved in cell wall biosynthesis
MAPRLSVVVPFYNVEDYIGDCLDSLARQTFDDFEVILVDDGSRDGSAQIAKSFCERDNRFRLVTQENQGLGPARNTGTRHAEGEYIAFVDSDDLVTRHAYETMLRSLDETGSSFAAGDARRFNNTSGVRESYLHRIPFAKDRQATHVFEFRPLALDRMVWNKVYRRSFWDEFGYEFPAIRYEDYPVTLKAHIEAVTVDCLAAPVYYWRERESGESITQLKFEFANLYDRVVSAEMVMDLLDAKAPELRGEVHRHFAQIDLAALVQAFGSVPEHEQDKLVQLGHRLAQRLDQQVLEKASPYDRLQYRALQTGDVDLLHRLAQFRLDGGLRGGARARRHPTVPWRFENQYPGLNDHARSAPRKLYQLPRTSIYLHNSVTSVAWDDEALIVRGTAEIRHLVNDQKSALRAWLVRDGREIPLPVQRFDTRDSHGDPALVGFEARVRRTVLAAFPPDEKPAHFLLELRRGLLRRRSALRNLQPGNPQYAPGDWATDDVWIQPSRASNGRLVLQQIVRPFQLTSARVDDAAFVLSGRLPGEVEHPELRLSRSSGAAVLHMQTRTDHGGTSFEARLPFATIVDAANPDDPFTQRTTRVPSFDDGTENRLLLATGLDRAVSAVHEGRLLILTRSPANYVNLHEGPPRLIAERIDVDSGGGGHRLTVHGPWWEAGGGNAFVWRRFLENSDDYVDVACQLTGDDRRWSAAVELADLLPPPQLLVKSSTDPLASLADWTLFAVPAGDESAYAIQTDVFLLDRLPIDLELGERRITLQPRVLTLHLEVR